MINKRLIPHVGCVFGIWWGCCPIAGFAGDFGMFSVREGCFDFKFRLSDLMFSC